MCIKLGQNELATVRALMTMAVNAAIADAFNVDPDAIRPDLRLVEDLGMDEVSRQRLLEQLHDIFDDSHVALLAHTRVGDILEQLVEQELAAAERQLDSIAV